MMKTLTAVAVVLAASVSLAQAQTIVPNPAPFTNQHIDESFVAQIGNGDVAGISQTGGGNTQATLQIATGGLIAGVFPNGSKNEIANNVATTVQQNFNNASNAALTLQVGANNVAATNQQGNNDANTSLIGQFGVGHGADSGNLAAVAQNSGGSNHVSNGSAVLQIGSSNTASVSQSK